VKQIKKTKESQQLSKSMAAGC